MAEERGGEREEERGRKTQEVGNVHLLEWNAANVHRLLLVVAAEDVSVRTPMADQYGCLNSNVSSFCLS